MGANCSRRIMSYVFYSGDRGAERQQRSASQGDAKRIVAVGYPLSFKARRLSVGDDRGKGNDCCDWKNPKISTSNGGGYGNSDDCCDVAISWISKSTAAIMATATTAATLRLSGYRPQGRR